MNYFLNLIFILIKYKVLIIETIKIFIVFILSIISIILFEYTTNEEISPLTIAGICIFFIFLFFLKYIMKFRVFWKNFWIYLFIISLITIILNPLKNSASLGDCRIVNTKYALKHGYDIYIDHIINEKGQHLYATDGKIIYDYSRNTNINKTKLKNRLDKKNDKDENIYDVILIYSTKNKEIKDIKDDGDILIYYIKVYEFLHNLTN